MRISLAVTNDLVTDQRVARTCQALYGDGYELTLIGRRLPDSRPLVRPYRVERMRLLFRKGPLFYAEYNLRLFFLLLFSRFDMAYANDTDTLLACYLAARLRGKAVLFDAHEMFPEVPELVGRPRVKRFWDMLERRLMPRVDGLVTVSRCFADIYGERFGVEMAVVRNVPRRGNPALARPSQPPVILYQGAVNVGRGIDWLIDTMEFLPDCRFVVVGTGDEYALMRDYAASKPWHDRIEFCGRMEPEQLRTLTPTASLGVCLLDNLGKSYYYTLPNRVGDFIAAGVPLLLSDFPELRRAIDTYGVGGLVGDERGERLAEKIRQTLADWQSLAPEERMRRMNRAGEDYCWENDSQVLLAAVRNAFTKHEKH